MCEIECNYKGKCTSYPAKCGSCKHNTGKRDYFEPDWPWHRYYPWYPYYPWYVESPTVWVTSGNTTAKDYYTSR